MLIGVLWILITVCIILGIIVCAVGMKTKNVLYKGGFYFFILIFLENIYSTVYPRYIQKIIDQGLDNPGLWLRNLTIPSKVLTVMAFIILIVYLFKGLNDKSKDQL